MTAQYDSVRLLDRVASEFREINLPFKVKMVERLTHRSALRSEDIYIIVVDINSECSEEEFEYIKDFTSVREMITIPMMDFQNLRTADYFDNQEDAFNFNMSLEIEQEKKFIFTITMGLEDMAVESFIKEFRDKTEPLRLIAYEKQFDEDVDDHLSEKKDDNGHK